MLKPCFIYRTVIYQLYLRLPLIVLTLLCSVNYSNASQVKPDDFNTQMDHYQQELMLLNIKNKVNTARLEDNQLSQKIAMSNQTNQEVNAPQNTIKVTPTATVTGNADMQNIALPKLVSIYGSQQKLYAILTFNNQNLTVTSGDKFFRWQLSSLSENSATLVDLQTHQNQTIYLQA